jgi:hypothetical protein
VAAESAGGVSDYSDTCFITTEPEVPGSPEPPSLLDKPKAVSVHLSWKYPDYDGGAIVTEFEIDMTSTDNMTRRVYRGRDTECVIASLLPGRPYLFQVRAHNRAGAGPWSQPLEAVSGAGPPDKPKEPKVVCRSGSLASVTWEEPINNGALISQYRLEMASVATALVEDLEQEEEEEEEEEVEMLVDDNEDENTSEDEADDEDSDLSELEEVLEVEATEICDNVDAPPAESEYAEREAVWEMAYSGPARNTELRDLTPATQYQLRVCAINSAGASPYSCNVVVSTPASTPTAPHILSLQHCTCSSMSLTWTRPHNNGEAITHYTVEWGQDVSNLSCTTTNRCKVNVPDLKPDTTYMVRVQAHNSLGPGPVSPSLKVRTKALPPAPPKLDCVNVNHNSIKLKWGDVKVSSPANYILEMENSRKQWYQLYNGTAHSYKANKLYENTEYRYRIAALTEAGQGPFSTPFTFKTAFAHPPAVKAAPRVTSITDSGCVVEWGAVRPVATGDHLRYQVEWTRVKDGTPSKTCAGTDLQFRIEGLEAKSEYTVRVAAVRSPHGTEQNMAVTLVGPLSPASVFSTLPRRGSHDAKNMTSTEVVKNTPTIKGEPMWTDQQWAIVILVGFTFFALIVAVVIQQLISISL